ncbi:copper resistance protein B [Altererythrobacter confluentis]|uniref:Copper resistance protein B n=1 Tax=Allopontixanthobacter confluentis TaxID=1849021 RepID=A0A6L7GIA6_9SPHN|nr:copper resistance protein B [Allopontixanthobacter confluentis]MXP15300.1 copper resistance protein B [Allopontixanthobacter confluentis]
MKMWRVGAGICAISIFAPAPAVAQAHDHQAMMQAQAQAKSEAEAEAEAEKVRACEEEAERHRAMGHIPEKDQCQPATKPVDHAGMDHSTMDHSAMNQSAMDHSAMGHGAMDHGAMDHGSMGHGSMGHGSMGHGSMGHGSMGHGSMGMPAIKAAPPAAAGSGPARAADAIWGAAAMQASRDALAQENGGMQTFWFQADRAEYRMGDGRDGYLWDVQAYYGGDLDKIWFKSEGEGSFGEAIEEAEFQALYSHAIGPYFDLQVGVRQDVAPQNRTYAVIGAQGLAPYLFEIDAAAFLSDRGDITARVEAELDQKITQRLILQPRLEINLAAQDVAELGIGTGLDSVEAGVRLRYEFAREFAPYIGIAHERKFGGSADFARLAGEDRSATNFVLGVRFWF